MAFFEKIKAAFDSGGIKVKLEVPRKFTWGDASVPATVTLTGHKSERRRVEALRFSFEDEAQESSSSGSSGSSGGGFSIGPSAGLSGGPANQNGQRVRIDYHHEGPIDLEPGQVETLTVDVPLQMPASAEAEVEAAVPGFLGKALKSMATMGRPDLITHFVVSVATDVEGVKKSKATSKRILNSASQGFTSKTTVLGVDF